MADVAFTGSVPKIYERYLVPLIFEPYAADLARRVAARSPKLVLEVAAGTGVVTRRLAETLPEHVAIVATDLNQAMLDEAAAIGTARPVEWRQMDAMSLPFADASFDVVACQFGVMFFPDRPKCFSEARRVLRPGGALIFNTWDRISENEIADLCSSAVAALFPKDPPGFLPRTPYGYHDRDRIERDVTAGALARPRIETVTERSRAKTARDAAIGFVEGSPLRGEIEARDPSRLREATDAATAAIAKRSGVGPIDAKMQALVVTAER